MSSETTNTVSHRTGGPLVGLLDALAGHDVEIVDLTNRLSHETPTLRLPEPFANLIDFSLETVSEYDEPGPFWKHQNIHTGEHIGTHIDAPIHWVTGRHSHDVADIPLPRLIGPAVVLDFTAEAAADPDFLLEVEHIQAWEEQHGPLPEGGWVLYRTGWDAFARDRERFLNADESGSHTPGASAACAQWLSRTGIAGFGVETVGIDAGKAGTLEPIFPMHYYLLGADKYGLTSLQNLAQLPPRGAMLIVAPLPIVGGTGSPARVLALVPRSS
ncbi:cyclase family protein [Arthrobacter mangrovi]|uniref:Cyclase n=1 Tax=Arthrobacter mangrovi TaxID=2966350 RepID=A0ABQ5MYH8_9MICC|nr:cyclase family protein [Arthrobacter mangrovi]GLB69004.1 cyclase [Arthrobacter mangrovi]